MNVDRILSAMIEGVRNWQEAWDAGIEERTNAGTPYRGLSDADMLRCQEALSGIAELLKLEEAKRDRCWDAADRWRVLQGTIAWVDSQQPVPRNSRAGCLAAQTCLLARLARQRTFTSRDDV